MSSSKLANPLDQALPVWKLADGGAVSCTEKIKVLNENYRELESMIRDAIEDGVLMGCSESQLRAELSELVLRVSLDALR